MPHLVIEQVPVFGRPEIRVQQIPRPGGKFIAGGQRRQRIVHLTEPPVDPRPEFVRGVLLDAFAHPVVNAPRIGHHPLGD